MEKPYKKMQTSNVEAIESPTTALDTLRVSASIVVPSYQRGSFDTTRQRMKDISSKRFSISKIDDLSFTIKRIR